MFKKIIATVMTALVLALPVYANVLPLTVSVNGETISFDVNPIIENGRVLVPVRGVFEKLGATVTWNVETSCVSIVCNETTAELFIGKTTANINGVECAIDCPPVIAKSRTLVPLRFIAESLGADVNWDAEKRQVSINTKSVSSEILKALHEFDENVFTKELLDYIISLFDPETGGYYYSVSARDNLEFLPDVESTKQAFHIFDETGLFDADPPSKNIYPADVQERTLHWAQSLQSEEDGYFYHPQWGKGITSSRQSRDLWWGTSIIARFGGKPLYLTPEERIKKTQNSEEENSNEAVDSLPAQFKSEEAFMEWVEAEPWDTNPYIAGNTMAASMSMITASGFRPLLQKFVMERQNQETGLWGEGLSYDNVNAVMKISSIFSEDCPLPMVDKIVQSIIYVMEHDVAQTAATPWNAVTSINSAINQNKGKISEETKKALDEAVPKLIKVCTEAIKPFKKSDGGYSWGVENSSPTSQLAWVSYGLPEGDLNGTDLCTAFLRADLYKLAGINDRPKVWSKYRDYLYEKISDAPKIVKKQKPIGINMNFEDYEIKKYPYDWQRDASSTSYVAVSEESENHVFEITKQKGDASLIIPVNTGEKPKKVTVFFDFMNKKATPGPLYYNSIGSSGIQWCICGNESGTMTLSQRTNGVGLGKEFAEAEPGIWYNLKFVYVPNSGNPRIEIYVDDVLVAKNTDYFGKGEKEPAVSIDKIDFRNFMDAKDVSFLLDNLKVEVSE